MAGILFLTAALVASLAAPSWAKLAPSQLEVSGQDVVDKVSCAAH